MGARYAMLNDIGAVIRTRPIRLLACAIVSA
jgi:hypothetical protein